MSFLLWIAVAVAMVGAALVPLLPAFVSFLALRGSRPGERPAILRALADVTATLSRRSGPQQPDGSGAVDARAAEQEGGERDEPESEQAA